MSECLSTNGGRPARERDVLRECQGLSGRLTVLLSLLGLILWDDISPSCHFLFLTSLRTLLVQGSLPFPPSLATSGACSTASEYHLYALNDQMFSVALLPKLVWRVKKKKKDSN